MKKLTFKIGIALLTFIIGVGTTMAWMFLSRSPTVKPVNIDVRALEPSPYSGDAPTLEMVFVLDTTGSMGGLIEGAKQRIWGIVNEVMQSSSHPRVRIGLVAYRDRGDEYVTKVLPLTNDLDKVYSTLMDYRANGGGDEPEDVRRALNDGVSRAGWSQSSPRLAQIIFLVGDAPPHNDYGNEPDTLTTAARAMNKALNPEAYVSDLLQNIENGSVTLDSVKKEDFPSDLQKLSPEARKQEIEKRLAERRALRAEIVRLSKQRDEFIAAEHRKRTGGQQGSFDAAVAQALKEQLSRKGIK